MKALTLWRPWSSFVVAGMKRFETRSWCTDYRGPLAIHSGMHVESWGFGPLRDLLYELDRRDPRGTLRTLGAVLGVVHLTGCYWTESLLCLDANERLLGNYSQGRWGWRLEEARALSRPVPCRGKQGLWDLPPDVEELVLEQLQAA